MGVVASVISSVGCEFHNSLESSKNVLIVNESDRSRYREYNPIPSFHVSCKSDTYTGRDDLGGIVLYQYNGQSDWRLNDVHCRSGYIVLKKSAGLDARVKRKTGLTSLSGQVHGAVYADVFGTNLDTNVIGSGFAYQGSQWKYNSRSFLAISDGYSTGNSTMSDLEKRWVSTAVNNWIRGNPTTRVTGGGIGYAKT